MNNIQINNIYNNVRNSNNVIEFYNSIQNANIYSDSDNESLETLDSDSDSELPINNNLFTNNPNYYHNLINSVTEIVHLDHIRRPINNDFNNNIFSQLDRIDILNNSNRSNIAQNEQEILNQSFEETSYNTNISDLRYNNKIKKLVTIKSEKEYDCTICMEKIEKNTDVYKISCNHKFHKQCLNKWLKEKFECPTCRTNI